MRVLILGNSDALGYGLEDVEVAWPRQLERALAACHAGATVVTKQFIPNGRPGVSFLERLLAEHDPTHVIVIISGYFTAVTAVEYRLRDRLGERAAARYKSLERSFDRASSGLGLPGRAVNSGARWVARRTVGTASYFPPEMTVETWIDVLDRLAREEQVDTIVMSSTYYGPNFQAGKPNARRVLDLLNETARAAAERHHFRWLDAEAAMEAAGGAAQLYQPDGVHRLPAGHDALLQLMLPAFGEA